MMRVLYVAFLIPIGLGGCLSYNGTSAPARETVVVPRQTVIVPAGSTTTVVVCPNGLAPPC